MLYFFYIYDTSFVITNKTQFMKKLIFTLTLLVSCGLTFAQDEDYGTGLDFDRDKYEAVPMSAPILTRNYTNLPSKYSLKAYAPTPGNQGRQPSCVGWASGYGARTIAYAVRNNWKNQTSKITQNAFSPSFVYNLIRSKTDVNCTKGSYISDAMSLLNVNGILKKNEFSYDPNNCTRRPSNYGLENAKNNRILTFERLAKWESPANLVGKVKKALANKNPVVIGMFKYGKLGGSGELWTPPTIPSGGGHAMVVVGYDNYKYGGAFEIMNSWGTNFRNNGFFWVRYNDFKNYVKTAYVLVDRTGDNPDKKEDKKIVVTNNTLSGSMTLKLSSGVNMAPTLSEGANRNFNIVKAVKTTYQVKKAYSSGTQFRIYLKSNQRGYVYLIGYGSADKSVGKLYPFDNFSDFFNYSNSEIAIPNEDYYIEFDNKPGKDILCVLYSKEKLDINSVISKAKYGSGDFVQNVKSALSSKMFDGKSVNFDKNNISFSASSTSTNAVVVPVFIEMNHQ